MYIISGKDNKETKYIQDKNHKQKLLNKVSDIAYATVFPTMGGVKVVRDEALDPVYRLSNVSILRVA